MSFQETKATATYKNRKVPTKDENSPIAQTFAVYQAELDAQYDKYERLVKRSRDLTIESKRIIFLLHRISSGENNEKILKEAEDRLMKLSTSVITAIQSELTKREVFLHHRAFSPGLQEYVEALSFYYYLKHERLISIEEVHSPECNPKPEETNPCNEAGDSLQQRMLPFSDILNPSDIIMGIADLTGELMRKCISSVASGNVDEPFQLCAMLQNIYDSFLAQHWNNKDFKNKVSTLKQSLEKVESACFAIKIRSTEIPQHMLANFFSIDDF